jgi:hypothetical protein
MPPKLRLETSAGQHADHVLHGEVVLHTFRPEYYTAQARGYLS